MPKWSNTLRKQPIHRAHILEKAADELCLISSLLPIAPALNGRKGAALHDALPLFLQILILQSARRCLRLGLATADYAFGAGLPFLLNSQITSQISRMGGPKIGKSATKTQIRKSTINR